jgi:micrococcal nuclease
LLIGVALVGGAFLNRQVNTFEGEAPTAPNPQFVQVLKVVDGDTIRVRFVSGAVGPVRYIGIDTPETEPRAGRPTCFAQEAKRENERLVGGRRVRLGFDADRKDRYDRLLAYVYAGDTMVNEALVAGGFARPLVVEPNVHFAERFADQAERAKAANRGLWKACSP